MTKKITELTELAEAPAQADFVPLVDSSAGATVKVTMQNLMAASRAVKPPVRVATAAAGTLSTDFENGDTVDGVVLATGDRILVKDQATASENGIYTVNASGAPTRAKDFDEDAEVTGGCLVAVQEGTANADKVFLLTTDGAIVVGTTELAFAQASGGGGGGGVTYDGVDTSTEPATDEVLWEGYLPIISLFNPDQSGIGVSGNTGSGANSNFSFLLPLYVDPAETTNRYSGGVPQGTRFSAKGRLKVYADTVTGAPARFVVGFIESPPTNGGSTSFINITSSNSANRDDNAAVVIYVDDSENIQSFNTTAGGGAALTDSGFNADLSAGTEWEIIIEIPSTYTVLSHATVTLKMRDDGGTWRTILNAVTPAAGTGGSVWMPFFVINAQRSRLSKVTGKLEAIA